METSENDTDNGFIERAKIRIKSVLNSRPAKLASAAFTGLSFTATVITLGIIAKVNDPVTYFFAGATFLFTTCRERRRQLNEQHHIEDEYNHHTNHERRIAALEGITIEHKNTIGQLAETTEQELNLIDCLINTVGDESEQQRLSSAYLKTLQTIKPGLLIHASSRFFRNVQASYRPTQDERKTDELLSSGFDTVFEETPYVSL